ncbi:unnamed protein product [Eruca vesicaria subsp. sativa]|uniref:BZIP domain-containing protein n=1 Tax=Eruca vesicaria subsp. sativa TaxID=29727 RepID=A0ABC8L3V1_ERUVS|nr:unnamed protein product [Eruca vesicaria subsp. sativa]
MASSEKEKSSKEKEPKQPSSSSAPPCSQEPSSAVSSGMATPDWSSFQAYSPMPPHGFVASSPQPPPYMWGFQHMMPPYGTSPHPHVIMYPPGGIYAHPSMPPVLPYSRYLISMDIYAYMQGNTTGGTELDSEKSDVKEKLPIRRSRGSLRSSNRITGKKNEPGINSEASANGAYSKSGESASDGLSEGSYANSENDSGSGEDSKNASENSGSGNGPGNGSVGTPLPPVSQTVPIMPKTAAGLPGPPTNLNIGMGYWGAPPIPGMHGKVYTPVPRVISPVSRDGPGIQDERELKRQRRKQSNREAAQRSRLRKLAECDELAQYTEVLSAENASLRAERNRLKSQFEELTSENTSLKDQFLSFPPLEGIKIKKEDQELDINQTGFTETKFVSYKDST